MLHAIDRTNPCDQSIQHGCWIRYGELPRITHFRHVGGERLQDRIEVWCGDKGQEMQQRHDSEMVHRNVGVKTIIV